MIQRHLFTVIQTALAAIALDPDILDSLFVDTLGLDQDEVDAIKKFFVATPPVLKHGYARSDDNFPMITITLAGENGKTDFMGDEGQPEDDPEELDFAEDVVSKLWDHSFQLYCYGQHPDVASYLYEIVKYALVENISFFSDKGLWDITLSGQDLGPDTRYAPEVLFLRALTFRCNDEFRAVKRGSRVGKAFKVTGIAVDNSGSSRDVGGVKTNVKVK